MPGPRPTMQLSLPLALVAATALLLVPDLALAAGDAAHAAEGASHGEDHGIPWTGLGLHAFNLVLLLSVIGFFAGKKIKDAMVDRATEIRKDIEESDRLRKEANARFEELQWQIAGFESRLAEMKAQAEVEAEHEKAAIMERAERESVRLREAAERTIRGETAKARIALRREAVLLAVGMAEQRLAANVGVDDDARLANEFFSQIDEEATHV